jgi:Leucine-rich repeat (LRR) protein
LTNRITNNKNIKFLQKLILANSLFRFLFTASKIENPEFLLDSTTPQGKAFEKIFEQEGIRKNRFRKLTVDKEWRILQRFSLMVVYFATGGEDEWFAYQGWRDFEDDECNWFGISGCEEIEDAGGAKYVTEILLTANNVVGKLPEEICLLKNLESIKINRNLLTGNIPECLSKLQKLKLLDLRYNQLDGTLPSGFFLSPVLEVLILSGNQLTGSIDIGFIADRNQIQALRSLRSLRLENNKLSGRIDPSILFLLSLNRLTLHGNDLSGSLDMICIRDLEVLTADCEQVTCTCCTQCY